MIAAVDKESGRGPTAADRDRVQLRNGEALGAVGVLNRLEEEGDPRVGVLRPGPRAAVAKAGGQL